MVFHVKRLSTQKYLTSEALGVGVWLMTTRGHVVCGSVSHLCVDFVDFTILHFCQAIISVYSVYVLFSNYSSIPFPFILGFQKVIRLKTYLLIFHYKFKREVPINKILDYDYVVLYCFKHCARNTFSDTN